MIDFKVFFYLYICFKKRGAASVKTLPLFVNQNNLNYAQQKEPVNINLTAKILGFAEILVIQSYFNTNLTIYHPYIVHF